MKKLPIGIQTVDKLLLDEYIYVDKTGYLKQLIESGSPHIFLSRPRRFGKSLLINTLKQILLGNKEIFKECEIYKTDYAWESHPVLSFDFSQLPNKELGAFEASLMRKIENFAGDHQIKIKNPSLKEGLKSLVSQLAQKEKVAVLVDEYDQPIINNLSNLDVCEQNRDTLKSFFETLKSLDEYIRFTFVTGVSKFSQVSLFSGNNYLNDITFDTKYSAMLGYTREELESSFEEHIDAMIEKRKMSRKEILAELKKWYNGYCFSEECELVYNPFSTLLYFDKNRPDAYWFNTGTPSFLIDVVKKHPTSALQLSGTEALKSQLADISRLDEIDLTALMFQTGYLTIKKFYPEENAYRLDFPNREVRESFYNSLLLEFAKVNPINVVRAAKHVQEALGGHDIEAFVKLMNHHFAKIPYQLFQKAREGFYHAVFLTFLEKSGIKTSSEVSTNIGRIDLVAEIKNAYLIFELKLDKTADIAFDQAEFKQYKERFASGDKDLVVIGPNFSTKSRNIADWKAQVYSSNGKPGRLL